MPFCNYHRREESESLFKVKKNGELTKSCAASLMRHKIAQLTTERPGHSFCAHHHKLEPLTEFDSRRDRTPKKKCRLALQAAKKKRDTPEYQEKAREFRATHKEAIKEYNAKYHLRPGHVTEPSTQKNEVTLREVVNEDLVALADEKILKLKERLDKLTKLRETLANAPGERAKGANRILRP